jgi:hypothetical protein
VGFLIAILALWRALAVEPRPGVGWTTVALGVWSVNAPFVLGYTTLVIALRNDVIVGVAVAIMAILSTLEKPREKLGRMTEQHHGAH